MAHNENRLRWFFISAFCAIGFMVFVFTYFMKLNFRTNIYENFLPNAKIIVPTGKKHVNLKAVVNHFYSKKNFQGEKLSNALKCRQMFELGSKIYPKYTHISSQETSLQILSVVDRLMIKKLNRIQSTKDYLHLVDALPSLVLQHNGIFEFRNETRLTQLHGKIPYLPCKIRLYSKEDLQTCVCKRKKKKETFWIAFIGDSKMRNKFLYLLNITNSFYNWTLHMENKDKEIMTFPQYFGDLKTHVDFGITAIADEGPILKYIICRFGIGPQHSKAFKDVYRWSVATRKKDVPDVIIIDFGVWDLFFYKDPYVRGMDRLYEKWKQAMEVLEKIAQKIPVIINGQSRTRSMKNILFLKSRNSNIPNGQLLTDVLLNEALKIHHSDFLDAIMLMASNGSNAIFWDSSIPFNLASGKECEELIKANHSSVIEESKDKRPYRRFMCHDNVHKSASTLHDEITMLLNLMCNNFMNKRDQHYCCT